MEVPALVNTATGVAVRSGPRVLPFGFHFATQIYSVHRFALFRISNLCEVRPMPIPVVTVEQMREWEKATWATGQTEAEVIRRVGVEVAQKALSLTGFDDHILILAGKGNNGADARAAREHLKRRRVDILDIKDPAGDLSRLQALLSLKPDLIVDGLFGIGLNRSLNEDWIALITAINSSACRALAVDVPSGLNAHSGEAEGAAIRATITLTVGAPKMGMLQRSAWEFVGRLEMTGDVGLVPCPIAGDLRWSVREDFRRYPPQRPVASHKGTYGHAALIAGSRGFHGAAVLAARGAQRAQPGLVTLYTMEDVYEPIAGQLQAVMVSVWDKNADFAKKHSAILIGPGLAADNVPQQLKEQTADLWRKCPLPMIVDASALAWLPAGPVASGALRLVTPHPGEAGRLLGQSSDEVQSDRVQSLRELSKKYGAAWVLLKGHQSLIGHASGSIHVNSSGSPHLAQGGSGDLLSGYLSGLVAQPRLHAQAELAIRYGVWEHGAAADRLQERCGNWVVEDLANELGRF